MEVVDLTEENAEDYASYLGEDVAENIGRAFYRGIVVHNNLSWIPAAGMVWEIKNADDPWKNTESRIEWMRIHSMEVAAPLFEAYGEMVRKEDVKRSFLSIPAEGDRIESEACRAAGFDIRRQEGDDLVVTMRELLNMPVFQNRAALEHVARLARLPLRRYRSIVSRCVRMERRGLCEDLEYLPISWFDMDVSCYSEKDGRINGLLLFHLMPSGRLAAKLLYTEGDDAAKTIGRLVSCAVQNATPILRPDTQIVISRRSRQARHLAKRLFPEGIGLPVYTGSREEV